MDFSTTSTLRSGSRGRETGERERREREEGGREGEGERMEGGREDKGDREEYLTIKLLVLDQAEKCDYHL